MADNSSRAIIVLGVLLALGMSAGAYLLGYQAKQIGGGRQSISVKGLAEKPVKADVAEWTVGVHVVGATFAEALQKSRAALPDLKRFLLSQGFDPSVMQESAEHVMEYYVQKETPDGRVRNVQQGYQASQDIVLTSPDLAKIGTAYRAIVQFQAEGHPILHTAPLYLVSNLEEVKMSLIGAATDNAKVRAGEFAKHMHLVEHRIARRQPVPGVDEGEQGFELMIAIPPPRADMQREVELGIGGFV